MEINSPQDIGKFRFECRDELIAARTYCGRVYIKFLYMIGLKASIFGLPSVSSGFTTIKVCQRAVQHPI
jgi:hypothetical protein